MAVQWQSPTGEFVNSPESGDEWQLPIMAFFLELTVAPVGAVMNQIQNSNLGADLFNGTIQ